jgi:Fic family protein
LHEKLMAGVQGHQAAPGRFRKIQNWIGKPGTIVASTSYIPPPPGEVEAPLAAWEKFLHESTLPAFGDHRWRTINSKLFTRFLMAMAEPDACS